MASSAEHQAKYAANRRVLDAANGGQPLATADPCWAAVVAFYAALHLVDRLAALVGLHPQNHQTRARFVHARHRAIEPAYTTLQIASETARYGTLNQFQRVYTAADVQSILIDQRLAAIEAYVAAAFAPPPPAASAP